MEKYLDKCLSSLIVPDEDLMRQLEVLVVNDGSKDRSSEIAHGYADRYPDTYVVIDKENGNYGSCINAALPVVTGKYVKILDADDWFDTLSLYTLLYELNRLDEDLILTDCIHVNEDGECVGCFSLESLFQSSNKCSFAQIVDKGFAPRSQMHNVAYKREIFDSIDYHQSEGISYTDMEWIFKPMTAVNTVRYLPLALYKYLTGRDGQTMDPAIQRKRFGDIRKMITNLLNFYSNYENTDSQKQYLYERALATYTYALFSNGISRGVYGEEMIRSFDKVTKQHYEKFYNDSCQSYLSKASTRWIQYWREGYFLTLLFESRKHGIKHGYNLFLEDCDNGYAKPRLLMLFVNKIRSIVKQVHL